MDELRLGLGPTEERVKNIVPEELRCKRSDGKQWRCSALSMADKTVCEKHYIQAKKRAANSARRANLKKEKRTAEIEGEGDVYLRKRPRVNGFVSRPVRPVEADEGVFEKSVEEYNGNLLGYNGNFVPPRGFGGNGLVPCMERSGTCHQCGKISRVSWCASCDKRGYCANCICKWYGEIPTDQIKKVCPACRGICNCQACLQGDNIIKSKVREMNKMEKLKHLHRLLVHILPFVKQIYSDQCFEIGVEARAHGSKVEIPRAKINPDQQMLCDFCEVPIFDYHRHCLNCSYDICLSCCKDIRESSNNNNNNNNNSNNNNNNSNNYNNKLSELYPNWKAGMVGTIPCKPGGCNASELVLKRILKINWISKLVKNTEEMVNGCKVQKETHVIAPAEHDKGLLYCPSLKELRRDGVSRFSESWELGIPVLVKEVFELPLSNSWDLEIVFRGIRDNTEGEMDGDLIVKAVDCRDQSQVEIEICKFIKGYVGTETELLGTHPVLKLTEWPNPNVLEEFLICERPEFLTNFPLIELIHSKFGVLNVAAKLPHDASMPEMGFKLLICYGNKLDKLNNNEEFGAVNLHVNMCDVVYMLMHTSENKEKDKLEETLENCIGSEIQISSNCSELEREINFGAIWDVFRREDVPKLNEFLRSHLKQPSSVKYPVYDGSIFLNEEEKNILKNEFGVEPWTIKQNISDAVFIPAGCPFQFSNLQSSVQLKFEFLFPESISESFRMAKEIRCLPNGHLAKLNMIEVRKMCLYAASSAIREIQKISLDPNLNLEKKFEDHNLTEAVSENLAKVSNKHTSDN